MYYDDMVKEAYEEILGFDKEAGIKDVAGKAWGGIKAAPGKAWGGIKSYGRTLRGDLIKDSHIKSQKNKPVRDLQRLGNNPDFIPDTVKTNWGKNIAKTVGAYAIPVAATAATAYGITKHRARKRAEQEAAQEQAEKAAAYYDEAQYIKEAAEADYDLACAYEDAALEILDELGYLD